MRLIVVLSSASFGVIGACITLPGTLLPLLVEEFGIRLVEAGSMLALQPTGYLLAVLVAGRLIRRCGMRAVLVGGLATAGAGFAGFATTSGWMAGAAMMFVTGVGFGVTEVATNTLLVTFGGERRSNVLNFAHLFFGVGSFLTPALVVRAVALGVSWRVIFVLGAALTVAVGIAWVSLRERGGGAPEPHDRAAAGRRHSRLVFVLALMLGVYVGAELGIGAWLTKYLVGVRQLGLTEAGTALSLYWLGLAAGRLALSLLAHRVSDEALLLALTAIALAAIAAALLVKTPAAAIACFAATGLGFSGIFPAVVALGGRHHPDSVGEVTSVLVAGAGIGGIVIPWAMSAIAEGAGLTAGMRLYAVMGAAMVALAVMVRRETGRLERET